METRICKSCDIEKPLSDFPGKRWKCRMCENAKKRENAKKKKESQSEINPNTLKTCTNCTLVKKISEFGSNRNQCKECCKIKRKAKAQKDKETIDPNETKTCKKCNETKSLSDFSIGVNKCKKCNNEEIKKRKAKRIEKEKNLKTKICKHCNIEQDKSKFRDGEFTCWDCQKDILYKWRKENPDKIAAIEKKKRSKEGYQERINKYRKDKYHSDINEKHTRKYHTILRNYLFKGSESKYNYVFECSRDFFLHWIEDNMTLDIKWEDYGKTWHLDHIKPCSSYDLSKEEEIIKCFSWKNTIPLKASDNLLKHNKIDDDMIEFYKLKSSIFKKKYQQKYQHIKPTLLKNKSKKENL